MDYQHDYNVAEASLIVLTAEALERGKLNP